MVAYPRVESSTTSGAYVYSLLDAPGVALSNNFLAVFNPANSPVGHFPLEIGFTCYTSTSAQVIGSMAAYRVTAVSGGTPVASTDVVKFHSGYRSPWTTLATANPTVTRVNNTAIVFKAPVISTGGGNSGTVVIVNPAAAFELLPGEGLVFNTAQGSTGQVWDLTYSWLEAS